MFYWAHLNVYTENCYEPPYASQIYCICSLVRMTAREVNELVGFLVSSLYDLSYQ